MLLNGLTVKDLQTYLGMGSDRSIYNWLEGKNLPSLDNSLALSDLFQIPVNALIAGTHNKDFLCKRCRVYDKIFESYLRLLEQDDEIEVQLQ